MSIKIKLCQKKIRSDNNNLYFLKQIDELLKFFDENIKAVLYLNRTKIPTKI